jgi:hypothetical protein
MTLTGMRGPHASKWGADIWGLGTMLYASNNADDFIFGHDGNNEPAINTAARLDPGSGDGIIILETGNPLLATTLAGEWTFWRTGNVDFLMLTVASQAALRVLAIGCIVIILTAVIVGWRLKKRARP